MSLLCRSEIKAIPSTCDDDSLIVASIWYGGNMTLPHRVVLRSLGSRGYVTHTQAYQADNGSFSYFWGHYFGLDCYDDAVADFKERSARLY